MSELDPVPSELKHHVPLLAGLTRKGIRSKGWAANLEHSNGLAMSRMLSDLIQSGFHSENKS